MGPRRSTRAAPASVDLTGSTDDESPRAGAARSHSSSEWQSRQSSPPRPQFESEDEDYINGILLAPASTSGEVDNEPPRRLQRRKKRVLGHSDEEFEPRDSPPTDAPESVWEQTDPSLHRSAGVDSPRSDSSTGYWERTGPSLLQTTVRSAVSEKGGAPPSDDGIDWGNDTVAVVIDTPKEWFERQARARRALDRPPPKSEPSKPGRAAALKTRPRRTVEVEVVIPVSR